MTDRRIRRTEREIKRAFTTLLTQKKLSKITIAEITDLADIGRGTFYTHYQDIYDLYDALIEKITADLLTIYRRESAKGVQNGNFIPLFEGLANYVTANKELFTFFANDENGVLAVSHLQEAFKREATKCSNKDDLTENIQYLYSVSGIFGIFTDWVRGKIKATPQELSTALGKIANASWLHR